MNLYAGDLPKKCFTCYHSIHSARVGQIVCTNAHINNALAVHCPNVYSCNGYEYEPGTTDNQGEQ